MPYHVLKILYRYYFSIWFENILRSYCFFWHLIWIRFLIFNWKPIRHSKQENHWNYLINYRDILPKTVNSEDTDIFHHQIDFTVSSSCLQRSHQKSLWGQINNTTLSPPICFLISKWHIQIIVPNFLDKNISLHTHFSLYSYEF